MSVAKLPPRLKRKKILVTGANGFLGKHLIKQLNSLCHEVKIYEGDIRKIHQLHESYDIVCHLAAITKVISPDQYKLLLDINIMGTLSVMNYCQHHKSKCVFASSSAVYKPTVRRQYLSEKSSLGPTSLYGYSKVVSENICQFYSENFNMYGPGQKAPFLIPYMMNQLSNNKSIYLKTPNAVRDFVYVADIAEAFVLACTDSKKVFNIFNVGSGNGISIGEVKKLIKKKLNIMHKKGAVVKEAANSKRDYIVSETKKIKSILKWSPQISLEQGISLIC